MAPSVGATTDSALGRDSAGGGRAHPELFPEDVGLPQGLLEASRGVDEDVREISSFLVADLGGDASVGLCRVHSPLLDQAGSTRVGGRVRDDDQGKFIACPRFGQQGNVVDDDRARILPLGRLHGLAVAATHLRMHDAVESGPRLRVSEDDATEGFSVQRPVGSEDALAEVLGDRGKPRRAGSDGGAGELIGVDDDGAVLSETSGDHRLTGGDPARQTDHFHGADPTGRCWGRRVNMCGRGEVREDAMLEILTGTGLAVAAGLNAYIPLLLLGLAGRFTDVVQLPEAWAWLTNEWVLLILGILLVVELVADKIPAVDSINDWLQSLIRPAAGGIVFGTGSASQTAAVTDPAAFIDSQQWVPIVIGIVIALAVHALKALVRPAANALTAGAAAPVLSTAEDVGAVTLTVLALLIPVLVVAAILGLVIAVIVLLRRARARRQSVSPVNDEAGRPSR